MSFRTRLLLAFLAVIVLTLGASGYVIRGQVSRQVVSQYQQRVNDLAAAVKRDLDRRNDDLGVRLHAIAEALGLDNRFRSGVIRGNDRAYVVDWAGPAMHQAGLDVFQVLNSDDRILSSGHFRNEYDLVEPDLVRLLAEAQGRVALISARTAEETFHAIARVDSIAVAGEWLWLVAGVRADSSFFDQLGTGGDLRVTLGVGSGAANESSSQESADSAVALTLDVPFIQSAVTTPGALSIAQISVMHSLAPLRALQGTMDRSIVAVLAGGVLVAVMFAGWSASRISQPLTDLADATAKIDLDRLDIGLASERRDEVGELARAFVSMTARLRTSLHTLKEVERRAAVGDIARQVNHDVKNGLVPIRNVFRHLSEVANKTPQDLPSVFAERRGTVETAVEYLETLAARYAALYPKLELRSVDANRVIRTVAERHGGTAAPLEEDTTGRRGRGSQLVVRLAETLPLVRADEMALRRVAENLVGNALDAAQETGGTVTVSTASASAKDGSGVVRIEVSDTGPGMTREQLDEAFSDFHTTKPGGTGLGLTIVRRLVNDLGGTLRVETEPGTGTRFTIDLPATGGNA